MSLTSSLATGTVLSVSQSDTGYTDSVLYGSVTAGNSASPKLMVLKTTSDVKFSVSFQ